MQQPKLNNEKYDGEMPYSFSPSISSRKIVDGKTYYVRRFFKGGRDFEKIMQDFAVKQNYTNMR